MSGRALHAATRWAARETAIGLAAPYTNPVYDAVMVGAAARDHGRSLYVGSRGLAATGRRSVGQPVVAGEWFHGAGDRKVALAQISADFLTLHNDLAANATSPDDAAWVIAVVVPTMQDWQTFATHETASVLAPWVTGWSVFEAWQERLRRLRELAHARGIKLGSPEPVPLPKTLWQRADDGTGSSVDVWVSALKTVILGAMAITGAAGLYSILREFSRRGPS